MLELKQTQKLLPILTQQLQQAIKLLQLSKLELVEAIEQELSENPVLEAEEREDGEEARGENSGSEEEGTGEDTKERDEIQELLERFTPSDDYSEREEKEYPDYENMVSETHNLRDYLRWQAGLSGFDPEERIIAEWLIGNIDDNGYLAYPLSEIAAASGQSEEALERVLKKIQKLDPPGVGARSLKECILLQYEARNEEDPLFEEIVGSHFDLIEKNNLKELVKVTGQPMDMVKKVMEMIKGFDPKPGRNFADENPVYMLPDVYVVKGENGFEVNLDNDQVPELRMSRYYLDLLTEKKAGNDARKYIRNKMKQAEWFIKSIQQRQKTLYQVAQSIVNFQQGFFENGVRSLRPLILKDVAQDVGVHESTVSRVTTNKYMSTPFGIYEMKFFFPTGIGKDEGNELSTNVVMDFIADHIGEEDKRNPLTDDEIVSILKKTQNITIARRTVAKYREILNIRSSRERKVTD
jgi:RNA polymerase sigma-54 factor